MVTISATSALLTTGLGPRPATGVGRRGPVATRLSAGIVGGRRRGAAGARVVAALFGSLLVSAATGVTAAQRVVFFSDFESSLPPELSAPGAAVEGVQGWAGLGPPGNQFEGSFLRYADVILHDTTLTLTGLPPHESVSVGFLLAVIDSWDGTELFEVRVEGVLVFSHWFQLATGDDSSYVPPPGGLLSSGTNLGFNSGFYYNHDRAYDLSVEPAFVDIPHTADSLTVVWSLGAVSGPAAVNWQGGYDESWAIDNLRVTLSGVPDQGSGSVADLMVQQAGGDTLDLTWSASCAAGDTDYGVYEGSLGAFESHEPLVCSTGGETAATIIGAAGDRYYLVVPRSSVAEGSHGLRSDAEERATGPAPCITQSLATCP